MSEAVKVFSFCLDRDLFALRFDDQHIEINHGLGDIESQSMRHDVLDHFVIENRIEVIEALLESTGISYQPQKIAISSDERLKHLHQLFFPASQIIDRVLLEAAFNDFVEHIEHYVQHVPKAHRDVFSYFIFIREMMHHYNVLTIQYIED